MTMSESLHSSLFADHLCLDAVVAFVDGEMTLTAFQRAAAHVGQCHQCSAEVAEQAAARERLRSEVCPSIPSNLMASLRSIPNEAATPPSAPGFTEKGALLRTREALRERMPLRARQNPRGE